MCNIKVVALALGAGLSVLNHSHILTQESEQNLTYTAQARKLDKDIQLTTASGATFTASKNWYVTTHKDLIVLEEPDRELSLALIENTEPSAQKAVDVAWQKFKPGFAYPIAQTIPGVAMDGWDETIQFMYDAPSAENVFVIAVASRKGQTWYMLLLYGAKGALERRSAQIHTVLTSFKAPGAQEESFAGKTAHKLDAKLLQELVAFIEAALQEFKIPGAAVGIVQDGKIIFEHGFGVRTSGTQELVIPETLFMIGSTTKSLTTFMMARLIDEGMFDWNTPVTQVMPSFKLGNDAITKQLLMKYMVAANTGIPRQDMEFMFNYDKATPEIRLAEMATMLPTTGFGETFQYSNGMVSAGGYIAAHSIDKNVCLGAAYDAAMQSRVFDPIGMKSTTFDFNKVQHANHASPHGQDLRFDYIPLPVSDERWVVSLRPAGGAWSTVQDMSRYIVTELTKGINPDGTRVVSEADLLKRREPQTKITDKMSYGLALMIEDDHGVQVIHHDGATMGFTSLMFFLPEHNVGLVMLTNARGAVACTQAVKRCFMELLFDGKPQAAQMIKLSVDFLKSAQHKILEEVNFAPEAAWLKQFVGTYKHSSLGTITISQIAKEAILDAGEWKSTLGQKKEKDGTLKLILTQAPFAGLEFLPQEHNGTMELVLEMPQHKYAFTRI